MFYSHEILTSPEHGVATVWLVATLGSRSITRRLNRKAILDVDVPKACGVIRDPAAPMALRLQGNLLYGVSRVYSQQCGYTLTDVQAMHDRMRAVLKVMPGGGLDPSAGKARPEQLILPYDPSFLPENNLPGLGLDLSKLSLPIDMDLSQQSSLMWPKTPDLSQSALSQSSSLRLDLSSDDIILRDVGGFSSDTNVTQYGRKGIDFAGIEPFALNDESGVILQPDFEFDEDGNIIELGGSHQAEARPQGITSPAIEEKAAEDQGEGIEDIVMEDQQDLIDEGLEIAPGKEQEARSTKTPKATGNRPSIFDQLGEDEVIVESKAAMQQRQRAPKVIGLDDQIALRNTELAHLNDNYVQNMAVVSKQKQRNKIPTLAKKNAAFWVVGQGIGSVGVGVGSSRVLHPLHSFSGEQLYEALNPELNNEGKKRINPSIEEEDPEFDARRVRPRMGDEDQIGRFNDDGFWHEDVEIGRNAPPDIRDDNSIQMPWNVTASVQSSRQGSSAANIFRGFGSASDFSSHGISDTGLGRPRSRLTSASPLAGRGFPFDIEGLNSLSIPGNEGDELNNLDDFDISQYLHTELETDNAGGLNEHPKNENGPGRIRTFQSLQAFNDDSQKSTLDQESLNFFEYLTTKLTTRHGGEEWAAGLQPHLPTEEVKKMSFSMLLPPQKTSRIVATQGLMHVLTLATKGVLTVHQEDYEDQSSEEYGVRYKYGEIHLCIPGL
ncbi:hypothetical protein BO94DRAFT_489855 [Aspergillus sclerotioniger CBS 115572]|uniref:Rad21/Rec8-like protein N-terminal domain-containing protein n=1 Tax=Aspergillus sclerotioniger CBS 115572 TaxID=1450535 RepID=A0A317WVQ3_9EURO|nr:hypothetical protein BO94DRAFT_489855 [Aspergillus sclerotioniger CBS 115572]PWY90446.1 hypothetical protein BO94DRAFT_489855 [Aspergillus sclerotioniger CBS 115572]